MPSQVWKASCIWVQCVSQTLVCLFSSDRRRYKQMWECAVVKVFIIFLNTVAVLFFSFCFCCCCFLASLLLLFSLQLASIAYASMSVPGIASALDCNLSNWLARLQHIKKMREKCHRGEDQPSSTHQHGNSQASRSSGRSNADGGKSGGTSSSIITNFTNFS